VNAVFIFFQKDQFRHHPDAMLVSLTTAWLDAYIAIYSSGYPKGY
jgi:hypothetical protein